MDLFYCTNAINYTVAVAGVLARRPRRAILVYERRRFAVRPVPGVWQLPISANAGRLLHALSRLRPFDTVHVPHPHVARRFVPVLAAARRVAWLDDGLDTLRERPNNFDLAKLPAGDPYFTFEDYADLPAWLGGFDVQRVCRLHDVLQTARAPRADLSRWEHVFIESPGLDVPALCSALRLDPARVLVVRHPVPHKQGPVPEGCGTLAGNTIDSEGSVLATRGKQVWCGETMVFFLLLHAGAAAQHRLWLHMDEARWSGLHGLPAMTPVALPAVRGRVAHVAGS